MKNYQNENLQSLLRSLNADSTQEEISKVFAVIANKLFRNYHIVKGTDTYDFLEIEFYFYSSKHRDLITYPRHCNKPGMWFFHMSGVDITFGTDAKEGESSNVYGGILVRSIAKTSQDSSAMPAPTYICGPMKCVDELFDYIDAFIGNANRADIPYLVENEERETISVGSCCRYIPLLFEKEKVRAEKIRQKFEDLAKTRKAYWDQNIPELTEDWNQHEYSETDFEEFLERPYRFYRNDNSEWMKGYHARLRKEVSFH